MAYVVPNAFTNDTKIEAGKIQENNDAVRNYLNGGIATSDIQDSSQWAETKHFMKGLYHATDNSYEMLTGVYKGPALVDLPTWHPGYAGKFLADTSDNPVACPNTGISFYLDEDADVMINWCVSPRGLALLVGSTDNAEFRIVLDDATHSTAYNSYTQMWITKEKDLIPTGVANDHPGFYRRRFYNQHTIFPNVTAGYHNIKLFVRSDLRAIPMKFCSYSLQAYYQV